MMASPGTSCPRAGSLCRADGHGASLSEGMILKLKSTRERLLASTVIVGALALTAGQAFAQASPSSNLPVSQPGDTGQPVAGPAGGAATIGTPSSVGVAQKIGRAHV